MDVRKFRWVLVVIFSILSSAFARGEWSTQSGDVQFENGAVTLGPKAVIQLDPPITIPGEVSFKMQVTGVPEKSYFTSLIVLPLDQAGRAIELRYTNSGQLGLIEKNSAGREQISVEKVGGKATLLTSVRISLTANEVILELFGREKLRHRLQDGNFTGEVWIDANLAPGAIISTAGTREETPGLALSPLFSSHAVLQRDKPLRIFGRAEPGAKVAVTFADETATTAADASGDWLAELPAQIAGGPHQLTVRSGDVEIVRDDILVGEVWFCTGQSNMQFSVSRTTTAEETMAEISNDQIRLFTAARRPESEPTDEMDAVGWTEAGPLTVGDFSAVGYYFGQALQAELGVPIGLINSSVGGTRIETWMPSAAAKSAEEKHGINLVVAGPGAGEKSLRNTLSNLYNGMIHPLRRFPGRGWIWYQGEANVPRPEEYAILLPTMIQAWRDAWQDADMTFDIVQLPGFGGSKFKEDPKLAPSWARLRAAQQKTADDVPSSDLITITDLGEQNDIHPANKRPVGERLAHLVLAETYGHDDLRPRYPELEVSGIDPVEVSITAKPGVGTLEVRGDELLGFQLRDADGTWHSATAVLEGTTITVRASEVEKPDAVRYNWTNWTEGNLFNTAGLPAQPFEFIAENSTL